MSFSYALHPRRSLITTLAAALFAVLLLPVSASAAPLRPGPYFEKPAPYDDSGQLDPECEGLDLTVRFRTQGVSSLRNVIGSSRQAFLLKDRYRFKEVWTDNATGRQLFTLKGRNVVKEASVRRIPVSRVPDRLVPDGGLVGPVFEFTVHVTGADVLRDSAGRLLAYQGGRVVFKNLFDSLGDRKPGGESLRFRPTRVIGPHPMMDMNMCRLAEEQLAAR